MSGRAVGIDLGTSNSVVSAVIDGEAIVIPDADGETVQPSVVSFLPDGRTIVGRRAKSRMLVDPANTIYSAKRLVGRPFYSAEIKLALRKFGYAIVRGDDDNPRIVVRSRQHSPDEIQSIILKHLKQIAEAYLGEPVTRAVVTVPANFNEAQRRATKYAGELAGLEVLRILNEPTAAALAYGYDQNRRERIAVYDLGGGTFDITILELRDNVFEVLSTAGDTFLGGDDFDHKVASLIAAAFSSAYGYDLGSDLQAMQRLKGVAERLKVELTDAPRGSASFRQLLPGNTTPVEFAFSLTREQFVQTCTPLVRQTFVVCDEALKLAGLTSAEVDRLVLVGGSTRVPVVRDMVEKYFFKQPLTDINPDEVVAVGAAIYAYSLEAQSAPAPQQTAGGPPPPFGGRPNAPLLIDVTPLSLGIETIGGLMDVIVARNSAIPLEVTRTFVTSRDNQENVHLNIYEGDHKHVTENRKLGEITLQGIRPAPRGDVKIDVTFAINSDGMLIVNALDRVTGYRQAVQINIAGTAPSAGHAAAPHFDAPASS